MKIDATPSTSAPASRSASTTSMQLPAVEIKAGDSPINDSIRAELEKYPQIKIEDTDHYYDISVYNKCVRTGSLLLNLECWSNIHPSLVTIPVEWEYEMPYGLLYGKNPSEDVLRFIKAVEAVKKATRK